MRAFQGSLRHRGSARKREMKRGRRAGAWGARVCLHWGSARVCGRRLACGSCLLSRLLLGVTFMVNSDATSKGSYKAVSLPEDSHSMQGRQGRGRAHRLTHCFQQQFLNFSTRRSVSLTVAQCIACSIKGLKRASVPCVNVISTHI